MRLIIGGIAERVDFAFEEIDDLQLAVERLLAEVGTEGTVRFTFEVGDRCISARVGPLDGATVGRALSDGQSPPGPLTLPRILTTVVDSYEVEDVGEGHIVVQLDKLKATP